jgi:hypothetical protein
MAAISTISLVDAESTPVTRSFQPSRQGLLKDSIIAEFEDRAANTGVPVGFGRLTWTIQRPTKVRPTYRINMRLMTPVLETVSNSTVSGILPQPTVGFTPMVECTYVIPQRSSLQQRKNLRKLFADLAVNSQLTAAVENLDFPY